MFILGLSGSIGMGKSTASKMFRRMGIPVYDSDASVHRALAKGGAAVPAIEKAFPGVVKDGAVDRDALGKKVFGDKAALKRLEAIVHPVVRRMQDDFLKRWAARRAPLVVLDIPLLFEVGLDSRCDATVVISAPFFLQKARVMARPGMTAEKFAGILARQMPDREKRRRADFVVPSNRGRAVTLRRLERIAKVVRGAPATHWPPDPFAERTASRRSPDARNRPRYRNHRS